MWKKILSEEKTQAYIDMGPSNIDDTFTINELVGDAHNTMDVFMHKIYEDIEEDTIEPKNTIDDNERMEMPL